MLLPFGNALEILRIEPGFLFDSAIARYWDEQKELACTSYG
jgi:hypothetical protein